jgi:hypothetical protein
MERLWSAAQPLDARRLPSWLTPADAADYRYVGTSLGTGAVPQEHPDAHELEQLADVGLIIDADPHDSRVRHVYISAPPHEPVWSIGIYRGESPFTLAPAADVANPVLTAAEVTDVAATYVADPFMLKVQETWCLFFEVMNWRANKGEIGLATSIDGRAWTYRQIVLAEPFHLSYPYVFAWDGAYYMVPESFQAGAVRLYRARRFPEEWALVGTLLEGPYLVDASLLHHAAHWWLFTETNPDKHDTLRLYYARDLEGPWIEHPKSPLVQGNPHTARPAGRVLSVKDRLVRFAQRCEPFYGMDVRAFEITELTLRDYQERAIEPNPVLAGSGTGWNADGMHHVDPHRLADGSWLACVDGWNGPEEPTSQA